MIETNLLISTDEGENWKQMTFEPSGSIGIVSERDFILIDKHNNRLVFVNWERKDAVSFSTNDNTEEYTVGNWYVIKVGK